MKMFDAHGNVMMEASSLKRQGDSLVMKGKMMGTMPATIYIKPEEVWMARKLLSWSIICFLPIMVVKGCKRVRNNSA